MGWLWHAFHDELASRYAGTIVQRRLDIREGKPSKEVGPRLRHLREVQLTEKSSEALLGYGNVAFAHLPLHLRRMLTALHKVQCPDCRWDRKASTRVGGFQTKPVAETEGGEEERR